MKKKDFCDYPFTDFNGFDEVVKKPKRHSIAGRDSFSSHASKASSASFISAADSVLDPKDA